MVDASAGARMEPGLCGTCGERVIVRNTRGSAFWLCGRSRRDDSFARYPRLPVLECGGYVREERGSAEVSAEGSGSVEVEGRGSAKMTVEEGEDALPQ